MNYDSITYFTIFPFPFFAKIMVYYILTRPDMRILGRIEGVRSTEQSVGIRVGGF